MQVYAVVGDALVGFLPLSASRCSQPGRSSENDSAESNQHQSESHRGTPGSSVFSARL